jgi:hypothetical protein
MRIDCQVSPNQTTLWTVAELHGCARARAISGPLTPVNHGQQRVTQSGARRRSKALAGRLCRSPTRFTRRVGASVFSRYRAPSIG